MPRLLALLLIFLLPLQGFGMVAGVAGHGLDFDAQHLADHANGVAHHHHDDGSIEHDDSDESMQHMSQHAGCFSCAAIASNVRLPSVPAGGHGVLLIEPPPIEQAFLDTLFRPPRTFG